MDEPSAAIKLCECGCSEPAPLAKWTNKRAGTVKGQPLRFVKNHSHRGKIVSAETRAKLSEAATDARHGNWKGDKGTDITYTALHGYLRRNYPKSGLCDECGKPARTEYALIKGREYSRRREDYRELCRPCHRRYDRGTLFSDEVRSEIRQRYAKGQSYPSLAAEYGVTRWVIGELVRGPRRHRKRNALRGDHEPEMPLRR